MILNSTLPSSYPYYTVEPYPLADLQIGFPPNPALTFCLIPWVRAVYMAIRRRLFRAILGQRGTPLTSPASPHGTGANPAVQLPNQEDFVRNHHRQNQDDFNADIALVNGDPGEQRRVVVTVSSGVRLMASSLLFPAIASVAGSALLWLARRQNDGKGWLARLLGLGLATSASSAAANMWGLTSFLPASRDSIDPVWWRNAVGGASVILVKDTCSLIRKMMELKRANSRRIQSQTIRNGLEI